MNSNIAYGVQPSQKLTPRVFLLLTYCKRNLQFLKKFQFENSGVNDSEKIHLCKILFENKNCYAPHREDVGKIFTPFWIRLKPDAKLQIQRPTKFPIQHRGKLNTFLDNLH